jgi:lysophospholipase L1-like esterase
MRISQISKGRLLAGTLIYGVLNWLAFDLAHNSYRIYLRYLRMERFPMEVKAALRTEKAEAALVLVLLYLVHHIWRRTETGSGFPSPHRKAIILPYLGLLCLLAIRTGIPGFLVGNLAFAYWLVFTLVFRRVESAATDWFSQHLSGPIRRILHSPIGQTGEQDRRPPLCLDGIILLVMAVSALLAAEILLNLQNTLYQNGRWNCTKPQLRRGVNGAVSFLTTRTALSGNHLNLGAWLGFQEVLYCEPVAPREIQFDFSLEDQAYLIAVFNRDYEGFDGLRLSRNPLFPSCLLHSAASGKFTCKNLLSLPPLNRSWNTVDIRFGDKGVSLYLNDAPAGDFNLDIHKRQEVGFRGCARESFVDNVTILQRDSGPVITETFRNSRNAGRVKIVCLAALEAAAILLITMVRLSWRSKATSLLFHLMFLSILVFMTVLLFFAVDFLFLSKRYSLFVDFKGYPTTIETAAQVVAGIDSRYPPGRQAGVSRILFLGTSQTWGAGAARDEETFVGRIETSLNEHAPAGVRYECLNGAVSGSHSEELLNLFKEHWAALNPDLVVVNLSNNDTSPERFRSSLEGFARICQEIGARILFVQEANSIEIQDRFFRERNFKVMADVGSESGIPVVDMNSKLMALHDEGLLWWDFVHLTSFGQELLAKELLPEIRRSLGEGK